MTNTKAAGANIKPEAIIITGIDISKASTHLLAKNPSTKKNTIGLTSTRPKPNITLFTIKTP